MKSFTSFTGRASWPWVSLAVVLWALLAAGVPIHAAEPATRPSAGAQEPQAIQDAKAALEAGRYKEARDLFLKAAEADPKSVGALHGAGVACLYLRDSQQANTLLERATALTPMANRALSYNFAVSDMNLGNYRRGAQTLQDYLYANPRSLDEPLLDALGAMLHQTGVKSTASRASDDTRKFFSVYTAMVEEKRPGLRKWGVKWLPAAEAEARAKQTRETETELSLLSKELLACKARVEQYRQELQAARNGRGIRSSRDASKLLNDEEKQLKEKQARYDRALATIDAIRPEYPQLLLPIGMDEVAPPPIEVAAAPAPLIAPPAAAVPSPPTPSAESSPAASLAPIPPSPSRESSAPRPTVAAAQTSRVKGPTVTEGIGDDQVRQCRVDREGVITVDREVTLLFHGTERRDYMITGEAFLGGGGDNGGVVFNLREQDGMHRYEITGGGMRAKRVLLEGRMVPKFEYPIKLNAPRDRWIKFQITANADIIEAIFDGQSGTARGPLSIDGKNSVVLQPGAKLRNVQVVKTADGAVDR